MSWSPNGRLLAFRRNPDADASMWMLSLDDPTEPALFYDTPGGDDQGGASFSPDGAWLAFHSDATGESEGQVYVLPVPATGVEVRQITQDGGVYPVWSPKGDALYYRRPFVNAFRETRLAAVGVITEGPFAVSPEQELPVTDFFVALRDYDITPDGGRFLMVFPENPEQTRQDEIHIVQNWDEELKRLVPIN